VSLSGGFANVFRHPKRTLLRASVKLHNALVTGCMSRKTPPTGLRELDEVMERSKTRTDISDHLVKLFVEALATRPRLIVELGVRGGESTFVLERVARLSGARLVSVDIEDCSGACSYDGWTFVQSDDVEFAGRFDSWCRSQDMAPAIDVLLVDTSHDYEQTLRETESWLPFLAEGGKAFYHDTNLRKRYRRRDRTIGFGEEVHRGVIRALEAYLGATFSEAKPFVDVRNGWLIRHDPFCCGMTILQRVSGPAGG